MTVDIFNVLYDVCFLSINLWMCIIDVVLSTDCAYILMAEDVLTEDKGECVICLDDLQQGDVIARLPCLCIYHKRYVLLSVHYGHSWWRSGCFFSGFLCLPTLLLLVYCLMRCFQLNAVADVVTMMSILNGLLCVGQFQLHRWMVRRQPYVPGTPRRLMVSCVPCLTTTDSLELLLEAAGWLVSVAADELSTSTTRDLVIVRHTAALCDCVVHTYCYVIYLQIYRRACWLYVGMCRGSNPTSNVVIIRHF